MAEIAHTPPRRPGLVRATAGLVAAAALAAGAYALSHHGSAAGPAPAPAVRAVTLPPGWTATPTSLRHVVTTALGARTDVPRYPGSDGLARVRAARCASGICAVAYNVDYTPAVHTIAQLTTREAPILAAAFHDPALRGISVTAWGPSRADGRVAQNPIFELDCSRADVRGLDLADTTASTLRAACAYVPYVHP